MTTAWKNNVFLAFSLNQKDAKEVSRELTKQAAELYFAALRLSPRSIHRLPSGKPIFEENGHFLSVSHAGPFWIGVFAPFLIGVDAEKTKTEKLRVAEKYFTAEEKKSPFVKIWTAKEAVAKLCGGGLSCISQIRISGDQAFFRGECYCLSWQEQQGYTICIATK